MSNPTIFSQVLLFNSVAVHGEAALKKTLQTLFAQEGYQVGGNLLVTIRDNASTDGSFEIAKSLSANFCVKVTKNEQNLGFCGAQNQAVKEFLDSSAEYFLMMTHDVALRPDALKHLVQQLSAHPKAGSATPKLLRGDTNLEAVVPPTIDAAGMYMTPALRHFDRGSGEPDSEKFAQSCFVFGGTGACLLLRRKFVEDAVLKTNGSDTSLFSLYPQLKDSSSRTQLLDEAFFAYREDADLAWRGQLLGWRCLYTPSAVGVHKRVVVPERRSVLPASLNLLGVRNRFLLQLNNFKLKDAPQAFLPGIVIRNLLVFLGVLIKEQSSFPGLIQAFNLRSRACTIRNQIQDRRVSTPGDMSKWFSSFPHIESTLTGES